MNHEYAVIFNYIAKNIKDEQFIEQYADKLTQMAESLFKIEDLNLLT